jgi:hypothetical protein
VKWPTNPGIFYHFSAPFSLTLDRGLIQNLRCLAALNLVNLNHIPEARFGFYIFPLLFFSLVRVAKPCQAYHSRGAYPSLRSWEIQRNLQLEVDAAGRLRLATMAHVYPILPFIIRYSCLLARTTHGVMV